MQRLVARRGGLRPRWRWLALTLALGTLAYLLVLGDVYAVSQIDSAAEADVAIVLGAAQWNGVPSPVFEARLEHAATLWRAGRVQRIITTGGTAQGDTESEAQVGVRYLIAQGIPAASLYAEPGGSTTRSGLEAAVARMRLLGVDQALLASDPFHMKRSLRIATDLGLQVSPAPVRHGPFEHAPIAVLRQSAREAVGYLLYLALGV